MKKRFQVPSQKSRYQRLLQQRISCMVWIALTVIVLCVVCDVADAAGALDLRQHCNLDSDWKCKGKDTAMIPRMVKEICQTCGNFWSSVDGLDLCCRCSDKIFDYCYNAILGAGRRR